MKLSQNYNLFAFFAKYQSDIKFLEEECELTGEWGNVLIHCITEALIVDVCCDLFNINDFDRENLIKAALYHDSYKKIEVRGLDSGLKYELINKRFIEFLSLKVNDRVIELIQSVGHTSLKSIQYSEDVPRMIMHIVDSMTSGSEFNSLESRIETLESNPRYQSLNEDGRKIWNGKTNFEMMLIIGNKVIEKLSKIRPDIFNNSFSIETKFLSTICYMVYEKYGVDI